MTTIVEKLAEFSHGLHYEDIPERVLHKARLQLFSVLGAINAGASHEIGKALHAGVKLWAGDGPCTIFPTGEKVDVLSAAYANAALSVALDYDDYLLFGHTGHSAVGASLAVAEKEGRSLSDAITAQIIANEIEGRLGAGVALGPHNGQGWSHIHLAGSAAAAAKLIGCDLEQTAHAIAISLYQPTYLLWPGFMGPDSKATTAATPTVTGIQAAYLAKSGATGPLDVIESPQGYLKRLSYTPSPHFITGMGKAYVTDTLAYKIYPGCAYIDTTVDAVLSIIREYKEEHGKDLDPAEIEDIRVDATILTVEMDKLSKSGGSFDPLNPVSINFSIPGNVALAFINGRLAGDDFKKSNLEKNRAEILEISGKVHLEHDWSLTFDFIRTLDETLKLGDILAELPIKELITFRKKAQENYDSSMQVTAAEIKGLLKELSNRAGPIAGQALKNLGAKVGGKSEKAKQGYDLGDKRLQDFSMPFSSRVTVSLKGGGKLREQKDIPLGGPGHPLDITHKLVLDKYKRESAVFLPAKNIEVLNDAAEALETRLDLSKLVDLCSC